MAIWATNIKSIGMGLPNDYHDVIDPLAGHGVIECYVYPGGFWSVLFPSLVSMSPFSPFCMGIFALCLYFRSISLSLLFFIESQLRDSLESQ